MLKKTLLHRTPTGIRASLIGRGISYVMGRTTLCYLAFMLACAGKQASHNEFSDSNYLAPETVVASFGGHNITLGEVDGQISQQLRELEDQRYQVRRQGLDQLVNQELVKNEAQKSGISPEQWMKQEIEGKVTPPTEAQIQDFFNQNAAQLPPGAKIKDFRERIVTFMSRQAQADKAKDVFHQLRQKANVVISLAPPPKPRVHIDDSANSPSRGPNNAPITLIEFSDFECPFCHRGFETIEKVMEKYPNKIRLVFKQFPLSFHAHAKKAAEASLCAHAQGKFWEYHNLLFAEQSKLEPTELKEKANRLSLNMEKFNNCLDKNEQSTAVDKDMAAAEKVGVTGTPAFFINGINLSGAQPIEEFSQVIEQELANNPVGS